VVALPVGKLLGGLHGTLWVGSVGGCGVYVREGEGGAIGNIHKILGQCHSWKGGRKGSEREQRMKGGNRNATC
jgi:hypothetical protein